MYFQYDSNGTPFGFVYNGTQYFYLTNQMNDVVGITDIDGNLIAQYEYDEWGNTLNVTDNDVANANPIRYRGYYYDNETGYYYLQSRYYDANICRFINADIPEIAKVSRDISNGANVFAYCNNNAVNNDDQAVYFAWSLKGWKTTTKGFNINISVLFLSRPFCRTFACYVIKNYGKKFLYKKMSFHRIEVELCAHAVGYYTGKILNWVNKSWGTKLIESGKIINVNNDDSRAWAFYLLWTAGSLVKYYVRLYCSYYGPSIIL